MARSQGDKYWKDAQYLIFDVVDMQKSFEERLEFLKKMRYPKFMRLVEQIKCESNEHLRVTGNGV
jgi:hypothetical protein